MTRSFAAAALLAGIGLVVACGDLKSASPGAARASSSSGTGSSSGASGSAADSDAQEPTESTDPTLPDDQTNKAPPPGYGPGPHGALPSGYCCTDDGECRSRHCEDLGGGKMCLDLCRSSPTCQRAPDLAWTCDNGGKPGDDGFCKPGGSFACIPAAQFELGTRIPGDCCSPTGDGWAGLECLGGHCIAVGSSPYVCTHVCVLPKDCPSGFVCQQVTETRKECIPGNRPYTCK